MCSTPVDAPGDGKESYTKLPGWIEELEDSKAFDSIVDLEDAPFDHLRQRVGEVYRLWAQPQLVRRLLLAGGSIVERSVSALSSGSSMQDQYLGRDDAAHSVEDDARLAARMVAAEDIEESRRQEQVAADQRMAVQAPLQEARQPPPVSAAASVPTTPIVVAPVPMFSVLQKSELPKSS